MKILKVVSCSVLMFGAATQANALMLSDGTDIGSADTLVNSTGVLSGAQAQVDWLNSVTGESYDKADLEAAKFSDVGWQWDSTNTYVVFELLTDPVHYLVKNATTTVAFLNISELGWGVIDPLGLGLNLGDDFMISFVAEAGGSVPEPATLSLLGAALMGLGLAGRRRKRPSDA